MYSIAPYNVTAVKTDATSKGMFISTLNLKVDISRNGSFMWYWILLIVAAFILLALLSTAVIMRKKIGRKTQETQEEELALNKSQSSEGNHISIEIQPIIQTEENSLGEIIVDYKNLIGG